MKLLIILMFTAALFAQDRKNYNNNDGTLKEYFRIGNTLAHSDSALFQAEIDSIALSAKKPLDSTYIPIIASNFYSVHDDTVFIKMVDSLDTYSVLDSLGIRIDSTEIVSSKLSDSITVHRAELNLTADSLAIKLTKSVFEDFEKDVNDTLTVYRSELNANAAQIQLRVTSEEFDDSIEVHRGELNVLADSIVISVTLLLDSLETHRSEINVNTSAIALRVTRTEFVDSIAIHNEKLDKVNDSIVVHRGELDVSADSIFLYSARFQNGDSLVSIINLKPGSIRIAGKKIKLDGDVSIDGSFQLNGSALIDGTVTADAIDANVSISAPNITGGTFTGGEFQTGFATVVTNAKTIPVAPDSLEELDVMDASELPDSGTVYIETATGLQAVTYTSKAGNVLFGVKTTGTAIDAASGDLISYYSLYSSLSAGELKVLGGTIKSAEMIGSTFKTATSGRRVEITKDFNGITFYDTTGGSVDIWSEASGIISISGNVGITGDIQPANYISYDGTAGATATVNGLVFKNGLYTSGSFSASGVSDGDKGDITVSGSGAVWNIDAGVIGTTEIANDAVTFAKMQNINTDRLLGRSTASSGNIEEITIGSGLTLSGGELSATSSVPDTSVYVTKANTQVITGTKYFTGIIQGGVRDAYNLYNAGADTKYNADDFLKVSNSLSDLGSAALARSNLGLVIGTNVQAYDADLTIYAGITPSANVQSILGAANYSAIVSLLGLGSMAYADNNFTANRVLVSNAAGEISVSDITTTELSYLDGVTSNIQNALDGKSEVTVGSEFQGSYVSWALFQTLYDEGGFFRYLPITIDGTTYNVMVSIDPL